MSPPPRAVDRRGPTRRPAGPPQGFHQWRQLLFVHWELDPAVLQATLPAGLQLDTHEGRAFVGLVLFTMMGIRPTRVLPPLPGVSAFHETNVRTYVLGPDGRPGVWFYSLDAATTVASAKAANTDTMMAAALVMRRPVRSSPSATARVLSPVRSYSSCIRVSMSTS